MTALLHGEVMPGVSVQGAHDLIYFINCWWDVSSLASSFLVGHLFVKANVISVVTERQDHV